MTPSSWVPTGVPGRPIARAASTWRTTSIVNSFGLPPRQEVRLHRCLHHPKWGSFGIGDGQFTEPNGVATDAAGNVYVADSGNDRVQKFPPPAHSSRNGVARGGTAPSSPHVASPSTGQRRLRRRQRQRQPPEVHAGGFITEVGQRGHRHAGQFSDPLGVATDAVGSVYVADVSNHRIQKFTPIEDPPLRGQPPAELRASSRIVHRGPGAAPDGRAACPPPAPAPALQAPADHGAAARPWAQAHGRQRAPRAGRHRPALDALQLLGAEAPGSTALTTIASSSRRRPAARGPSRSSVSLTGSSAGRATTRRALRGGRRAAPVPGGPGRIGRRARSPRTCAGVLSMPSPWLEAGPSTTTRS